MRRCSMTSYTLWLVRHGQSTYNQENLIQGHTDVPLSDLGKEQAIQTGKFLENQSFSHIYSSDLIRAKNTAEEIMLRNKHFDGNIVLDERIRERKFGDCEGKTGKFFRELCSSSTDLRAFHPPGGENLNSMAERGAEFFRELCQTMYRYIMDSHISDPASSSSVMKSALTGNKVQPKNSTQDAATSESCRDDQPNVLVVSHGGLLKELFRHMFYSYGCTFSDDKDAIGRIVSNASITKLTVHFRGSHPNKVKCISFNSKEHLTCCQTDDCVTPKSDKDVAL